MLNTGEGGYFEAKKNVVEANERKSKSVSYKRAGEEY